MYRFIPILPTKEAWETREFSDQPSISSILQIMRMRERPCKYTGFIYFHKGVVSTYNDGTAPRTIEPFPKELDAWNVLSANRTLEGIRTCENIFQQLKRLSYKARAFLHTSEQVRLENIDRYFDKPFSKDYQEFRHVSDLELQLSQIPDHSTIRTIWINRHGYFEKREY